MSKKNKKPVSKTQKAADELEIEKANRRKLGNIDLSSGNGPSVPYAKLSPEDKAWVDRDLPTPVVSNTKGRKRKGAFTEKDYEKTLTDSGQITDKQAIAIAKKGRKYVQENFGSLDDFTKLVIDDVPFDQMIGWVTSLMTGGSENKSWSQVIDKFFNFRLGQMDLNELMVHKYKLEELIKSKIIDKQQDEGINYKVG